MEGKYVDKMTLLELTKKYDIYKEKQFNSKEDRFTFKSITYEIEDRYGWYGDLRRKKEKQELTDEEMDTMKRLKKEIDEAREYERQVKDGK